MAKLNVTTDCYELLVTTNMHFNVNMFIIRLFYLQCLTDFSIAKKQVVFDIYGNYTPRIVTDFELDFMVIKLRSLKYEN